MKTLAKTGFRAVVTVVTFTVLTCGAPAYASQGLTNEQDRALSHFEARLKKSGSVTDQKAYAELSEPQKHRLANYLLGKDSLDVKTETVKTETATPSSFTRGNAVASTSTRTIWGKQWFHIGNLKISETKVRGTYTVYKGKVKKPASYSCTVVKNIDPSAKITSTKDGLFLSSGYATFKCKVTVKRGVPTPWGPIAWSKREAIQQIKGNSKGKVVSHKWV